MAAMVFPTTGLAEILKIGGNNPTHFTLDDAWFHATTLTSDTSVEIRIAEGEYTIEQLNLSDASGSSPLSTIRISGGWNANHTSTSQTPEHTTLKVGSAGGIDVRMVNAYLVLSSLTIRSASDTPRSRPLVDINQDASLFMTRLVVSGGHHADTGATDGGGLRINAFGGANITLRDSKVNGNRVHSTQGPAIGGALSGHASQNARIEILDCTFPDNVSSSTHGEATGSALSLRATGSAQITLSNSRITGNVASGGPMSLMGSALDTHASGTALIRLGSLVVTRSQKTGGTISQTVAQVSTLSRDAAATELASIEISQGSHDGLLARINDDGRTTASNLTVVAHPRRGIEFQSGGSQTGLVLTNSIVTANAGGSVFVPASATLSHNLIEGYGAMPSPLFRRPGDRDYRLHNGASAAIDAGLATDPSLISPLDAAGDTRVVGVNIDIGAYEWSPIDILSDGFESG